MNKALKNLDEVTIRFAGDSGDGMQLTGMQFTSTTAMLGNDLSTLPDYPAEIRAPAGTLFGVSGFQIHFGSTEINTPGDACDVLVAMNPAALKVNIRSLRDGGVIIANSDGFNDKNLKLASYEKNPLEDGSLEKYQVHSVKITQLTHNALEDLGLSNKITDRSKNFFALGMMYWMFSRPLEPTIKWIGDKFKKTPEIVEANTRVLKAGYAFGETTEIFAARYEVKPATMIPGKYRSITGNEATAWGLIAASVKSGLDLFLGSYPITPASDILHELSRHKNFRVKTFQAEDEIAGITASIGAAYGGALGATTTSGPGMALKGEALGLAVMLELPLIVIDVQRGGPSTGLPTKTEQADLLQALYGRNSEAPIPVITASTPADCFFMAFEAARIAIKYMTPVILLTDGYLANGAEPWLIPQVDNLPDISPKFRTEVEGFHPYLRDEKTLARPWAIPGTPGLEHRIGGLEKQHITGNVSYDPENHEFMVKMRQAKVDHIADDLPPATTEGDEKGDLLVVGWGGTYGAIRTAVENKRREGKSVSHLHLKYVNPFQKNVGEILYNFKNILVPELNLGQLSKLIRAKYLVPAVTLNKVQGLPFKAVEIEDKIDEIL
ncbi:MAG: 2-oxoacid:acceptor oxidoreductase subunit alpha [Ignavibacteriae bacterium]|nr:2-oxoacid:acceptor oxidoreductase subunit alpha [Ignavibacteria bacterium]MBI3365228.1 2-oxoacid:acceptor oxidoreductase subunit alpha [Ignavibacteriota bacterium]